MSRLCGIAVCLLVGAWSAGCASLSSHVSALGKQPTSAATGSGPSTTGPGNGARKAADPSAPKEKPFDEVIRGAERQAGYLPVWRKDDKVWIELAPEQFDQPVLLSVNVSSSVGERGLYASQMGPSWLATFRRVGPSQVQLIALNAEYSADGNAMRAAVEQAFSHSLLASTNTIGAPHPESKAVLIDASFLLGDIASYSTALERAYKLPLSIDRGNSFFEKIRTTDDLTAFATRIHYWSARIPAGAPRSALPKTVPDPRSLFVGFVYNFAKPADEPLVARRADPRLGHFSQVVTDLSNDLKANPRRFLIKRWRLEKKDPLAERSEPKQPIVYWLDRNIPPQYRKAVEEGILEWNKAFDRIGFINAIQVRQQPDDADWDNMDARHASVRWFVGADVGFAIGPSRSDPRTGEIFDADIGMSDVFGRSARQLIVEEVAHGHAKQDEGQRLAAGSWWNHRHDEACSYAHHAAGEMNFALDMLESRGDLSPDSAEAEAFVHAVIKDTIMHEVGHTLGLKHNFKGSTVVQRSQLRDRSYTDQHGISGSVMDYNAYNLAIKGEPQGTLNNTTIGPYDYWAIEYAYKPIESSRLDAELQQIAARSSADPLLAYADDSDADADGEGIDPLANRFDLGDDPLDFYRKRLMLSRELWQRVQQRGPAPGEDITRQRRVVLGGFRQLSRATDLVGKYVGGMHAVRDLPGTTSRRAFTPVAPAKQREALKFLAQGIFSADSFSFQPEFLANLAPDYNEWDRGGPVSIPAAVLQVQSVALERLLNAGTATRVLDLPLYLPPGERRQLLTLPEVYSTLQNAVWSELKSGGDIDRMRRNLQRAHLKRMQHLLTDGASNMPPDAISLMRMNAVELQQDLRRAAKRSGISIEARAHLRDSLALLEQALNASMTRS